jgi:SAM-dependent methyltransferase
MTTPYDSVIYPGRAHEEVHPERLASVAAFYGMHPAPTARCRVLELGCGFGSNLIPIAYQYPDSHFIGIDLSRRAIEHGSSRIAALDLKNVELLHCDIMAVTAEHGQFDSILAHGVYSWVPAPVREKMLAICRENLAPQGVAYVSYNAYPGSHLRDLVRDMMLFHVRDETEPQERIAQARAILKFYAEAGEKDSVYGNVIRSQWARVERMGDEVLYHDDLDEVAKAFLLHQVVDAAGRHQLQYLCDVMLSRRDLEGYPDSVKNVLGQFSDSRYMERDQFQDFVDGHGFRRTLLCHRDVRLDRKIDPNCIRRFYISGSLAPIAGDIDLAGTEPADFKTPKGHTLGINHLLSKAAIVHLGECWPAAISFADLLANACRLVAPANGGRQVASEDDIGKLIEVLFRAACGGLIELHVQPPRLTTTISERPLASLYARKQAEAKSSLVTNLRHRTIFIDNDIGRQFLTLVDGTRNVDQLVADLADAVSKTEADPKGDSVTRANVEHHLRSLANLALLVA